MDEDLRCECDGHPARRDDRGVALLLIGCERPKKRLFDRRFLGAQPLTNDDERHAFVLSHRGTTVRAGWSCWMKIAHTGDRVPLVCAEVCVWPQLFDAPTMLLVMPRPPLLHPALPLTSRALVTAFAMLLVALSGITLGCPHGTGALEVIAPLSTPDEDADRLLREADQAAAEGHVEEARARYQELVDRHPNDRVVPLAQLGLGRIAVGLGHFDEAQTALDRAMQSTDGVVRERATLYRGIALHLSGHGAEALPILIPLMGHTTDPDETRLLLDTVSTAAAASADHVTAVRALDARVDATEEGERAEVDARLRRAVEQLTGDEIGVAYRDMRRTGTAWPLVAERALRRAHDAGDVDAVHAIAAELSERGINLHGELATLVSRAERIAQADVRIIGAILPLSGPARELGQRALRGLMIAAGTPSDGPQPPDAAQLVFRDDASDPERAVRAVDELVSVHRAVAIIGPLDHACAERAAQRARELGVPMISLSATELAADTEAFRLSPTLDEELRALITAAAARGARTLAVLRPETRWGERAMAIIQREAAARSLTVRIEEHYAASATSFGEQVTRIAAAQPDAVLIADAGPRIALLAPALATAGLWAPGALPANPPAGRRGAPRPRAVQLLIPSVGFDPRLVRTTGRYLQGALFVAPFVAAAVPAEPLPAPLASTIPTDALGFATVYRTRFQTDPDAFAAYAFDAFSLVRRSVLAGARGRGDVSTWLATSSAGSPTLGASGGFTAHAPFRAPTLVTLRGESFGPDAN